MVNSDEPIMMSLFCTGVSRLPYFTLKDAVHGPVLISVCTHILGDVIWTPDFNMQMIPKFTALPRALSKLYFRLLPHLHLAI